MSGLSVTTWFWLSLLSGVMSDVSPTAPDPSTRELLKELHEMNKELLNSFQESMQTSCAMEGLAFRYPIACCGSSLELSGMKKKLLAIETDMQRTKTKLQAAETKLQTAETKLQAAETKLQAAETELQSTRAQLDSNMTGGSTFIRWGRTTCTNSSQLVYSGVAGGSWYDHTGAAANRLCLTLNPQFDDTHTPAYYSYIYGAEYENIPNHHQHDVPCSVCRTAQSTTIMVPATHVCPTGWTTQYTGHLAAGYYGHKGASEYVCLDGKLENADSGHVDHNGNLFYYTITKCGSLPCPPYANDKVVICTVCSK